MHQHLELELTDQFYNKTNERHNASQLALRRRVQRARALRSLDGLLLDAREQRRAGGDVVDEADDLTGGPDLHTSASHTTEEMTGGELTP